MTKLSELERQPQTFRFEKWGRDVTMRPLAAVELFSLKHDLAGGGQQGIDNVDFLAELLSRTIIDPQATVEEWRQQAEWVTLIELGNEITRRLGLNVEEKKTDSTADP